MSDSFHPMDSSPPSSSVLEILQARILEWVAVPTSRGSSPPRDQICISYSSVLAGGFFINEPMGKPLLKDTSPDSDAGCQEEKLHLSWPLKCAFPFSTDYHLYGRPSTVYRKGHFYRGEACWPKEFLSSSKTHPNDFQY